MDTGDTLAFGRMLRGFRLDAGLSQEMLAERSGLSARGISDLERGARRVPRSETVRLLAGGLGLDDEEREAFLAAAHPRDDNLQGTIVEASPLPRPVMPLIGREDEL